MTHLGLAFTLAGLAMCVVAGIGAAWSCRRMPGTLAGVALSFACGGLALGGVAMSVAGVVIGHG